MRIEGTKKQELKGKRIPAGSKHDHHRNGGLRKGRQNLAVEKRAAIGYRYLETLLAVAAVFIVVVVAAAFLLEFVVSS